MDYWQIIHVTCVWATRNVKQCLEQCKYDMSLLDILWQAWGDYNTQDQFLSATSYHKYNRISKMLKLGDVFDISIFLGRERRRE